MKFFNSLLLISVLSFSAATFSMESIKKFAKDNQETILDCTRAFAGGFVTKFTFDKLSWDFSGSKEANRKFYINSIVGTLSTANILFPFDSKNTLDSIKKIAIRFVASSLGYATRGIIANL